MTQGQLFDHLKTKSLIIICDQFRVWGSDPRGRGTVSRQEGNILLRTDR